MSATQEQRDMVEAILATVVDDPKRGVQAWLFTDELAALRAVLGDSDELARRSLATNPKSS